MEAFRILAGALWTVAVCLAAGGGILRGECRDPGARFVVGAAALSVAVFALCAAGIAYPWVMAAAGAAALCAGSKATPSLGRPRLSWWLLLFAPYLVLYLCHAMAPEVSPDGAGYHLGLVTRYLREHGFARITDNLYAGMPGGVEMLFLFAFPLGRHSAAALVHLAFLPALAWQMYRWARGMGSATAGAAAALLVVASPVIGIDATSAYNDVALAAIAFTLFHLVEQWCDRGGMRLAAAIGLVGGFAFATKYTAGLAILYGVAMVGWRNRRAAAVTAACAALVSAPWLVKNWIYLQNPLAPFFNRLFPNPYVMVAFEDTYRGIFASYGLASRWSIPLEATTRGALSGVLGPVFLLAPLGLLALRRREGRRLWLAALIFGAAYFGNIGTRFLIPVAPFLALALMLALCRFPRAAIALALLHAVISWPALVPRYARPDTWRLEKFPWRDALRLRDPSRYLEAGLSGYGIDRLIEERTRPASTVFTFTPIPEAYTSRHIRVEYQAAGNKIAGALVWTAVESAWLPTRRLRFAFPRQAIAGFRLLQTGAGSAQWTIHELRVFDGASELPREADWRLTAHPYPWGVQDAFDNSLLTFWMCGEFLRPGQSVEAVFAHERQADEVLVESSPNQPGLRLRLEGRDGAGKWRPLSDAPAISSVAAPLGLRRAAAEEMKRRGIDYVLLFDGQVGADDFQLNAGLWRAAPVGEYRGARLYELQ